MNSQQPNQPQWGGQGPQQWGGQPGQVPPHGRQPQGSPQRVFLAPTPPLARQPQAAQQWGTPPGQTPFPGPSMPGGIPPLGGGPGIARESNKNVIAFGVIGLVTLLIVGVIGWAIFGRGGGKDPLPTPPSSSSSASTEPSSGSSKSPSPSPSPTSPSKPPTGGQEIELWEGIAATLPAGWMVEKKHENEQTIVVLNEDRSARMTLQAAEGKAGHDAVSLMDAYLQEQGAQFQNPTYLDAEEITTTSAGNAATGGVSGVVATGSGSFAVVLVSVAGVRSSDNVFVLCTLLLDAGDPNGEAIAEDWGVTSESMVDSLLG